MSDRSGKKQRPPTLADQNRQALRRLNAQPQTIGLGGDTHHPSNNIPSLSRDSSYSSPHTSRARNSQNYPFEHTSTSKPPVDSPSSDLSSIPDSPVAAPPSSSAPASLPQAQGHDEHPKRANKREADAINGPIPVPQAKILKTQAAPTNRSKPRDGAVTAESLDAWRGQLLKMRDRVAKQTFPTADTRTPMSNNDNDIPVTPSGHPASVLKLDAHPAPVPSHPSGNRHGRAKKQIIPAVNKTQLKPKGVDIRRTAPSSRGKPGHVHSAPCGVAGSSEIQHHKVKKKIPPPVYVSTLQDDISPITPMITSPDSNSPDTNPLLDLLSAAPSPHPDREVIDQRIQHPPSRPSPCYLISPTDVAERSDSDVQQPDLIILSPTDYLGLSSKCCSPLSCPADDQQDEKPMLGSHDAILESDPPVIRPTALYDPLVAGHCIDPLLDTVPASHEQRILLLCCPPPVKSAPTMSNTIESSAPPPSSAIPIPQEEFICQLVQAKLIPRADHRSTQPGILQSLPALQEDSPNVDPIELRYQRSLPPTDHGDPSSAQSQSQNSSDQLDNVSQNDSDELEYMSTSQASIDELESMSQDPNTV